MLACIPFSKNECNFGDKCQYSHAQREQDDYRHRMKVNAEKQKKAHGGGAKAVESQD